MRPWDPATGAPAGEPLTGHTDYVESVAFGTGPDGRLLLASGSGDRTVRLWDPATGAPAGEPLTGHTSSVASVAFGTGPDGRLLLASGSGDRTVRLWDPVTGAPAGEPLTGHTSSVASVAFGTGPDGRLLLASGSGDRTVRLWDLATRACIATLQRRSRVRSIAAAGLASRSATTRASVSSSGPGRQHDDPRQGQACSTRSVSRQRGGSPAYQRRRPHVHVISRPHL